MWDTDVCVLHIQLMGTNVRLPKIHVFPQRLIQSLQNRPQCQSIWINPIDNGEPCFLHGNIVCHHSYDACKRSNEPSVCLKLQSILWLLVQICVQTMECLVYQFVPCTSMLLTVHQLFPALPPWSGGYPCKEWKLCTNAVSCCRMSFHVVGPRDIKNSVLRFAFTLSTFLFSRGEEMK